MTCQDSVILNYHESLLRKSDIDLISGPYWLNDNVISFYFEFLEKEMFPDAKHVLFISPQVTQCLKLVNIGDVGMFFEPLNVSAKNFIFFALNDNESTGAGGCHWSLLVYSRPENRFFHFDSSQSSANVEHAGMLATHILPYLIGRTDGDCNFTNMETLQQNNGYDCGIHVLCNTNMIVQHILKFDCVAGCGTLTNSTVNSKRTELLDIIDALANKV